MEKCSIAMSDRGDNSRVLLSRNCIMGSTEPHKFQVPTSQLVSDGDVCSSLSPSLLLVVFPPSEPFTLTLHIFSKPASRCLGKPLGNGLIIRFPELLVLTEDRKGTLRAGERD